MNIYSVYPFTMVVTFLICGIFAAWMLKKYNIIGGNSGTKKAKKENQAYEDIQFEIKVKTWFLGQFENFARLVGGGIKDRDEFEWGYRIMRVMQEIKYLNRKISPIEFVGMLRLVSFLCITFGAFSVVLGSTVVGIVLLAIGALFPVIIKGILDMAIGSMDRELEHDFPSLYLLLYCRLLKGVNARLAPTLNDYTRTMNAMYGAEEHKQIRQFVLDLRNNIEVYADESEAISKMKEKYHSAMILNFINIAGQALKGSDNSDQLLSFKVELSNREAQQMAQEAAKRAEKARAAIYVTFVILFEFIVLSVVSKMPSLGSMTGMLG